MNQLSAKTKFLNFLRAGLKTPAIENALAAALESRGALHGLLSKFVPNYYQYREGTLRRATRGGIQFELDLAEYLEHSIFFNLEVEPKDKLYALPKPTDIVFDIGGNIGETILNFGKKLTTGRVYGFEPVPKIFQKLKTNVELNHFPTVQIENLALSDARETLNFSHQTNQNSGGTRMRKPEDAAIFQANQAVQALPLDEFVAARGISKIDFIKIDVEGFEMNVLRGAEQSLRRFRPTMVIEIDDAMLREQHTDARTVLLFLKNLGYALSNFNRDLPLDLDADHFTNCHFDVLAAAKN